MTVAINPSYIDSLRSLTANEAMLGLNLISKFIADRTQPGIDLERFVNTRSSDLWTCRIDRDLRSIVYKDSETWFFLYADHHREAHRWAERRTIGRHSVTGELQIVQLVEIIQEIMIPIYQQPTLPGLFDINSDEYLISLGVPTEYLPTIREIKNQAQLSDFFPNLQEEVWERLSKVALGEIVAPPTPISLNIPLKEIPEEQRRFFIVEDNEELQKILQAPLEKWLIFMHPSQKNIVKKNFNGPAKVTGSAGTGKTVVAIHRAKFLAAQGKKVLITSYVTTLCKSLERNIKLLCNEKELANIKINNVHSEVLDLLRRNGENRMNPISSDKIKEYIESLYSSGIPLNVKGLIEEWDIIIQGQGITNWEQYRDASRVGRGIPLKAQDRKKVWDVLFKVMGKMSSRSMYDWSTICRIATEKLKNGSIESPYDCIIVDEVQDLKSQELCFLSSLAKSNQNNLFLVGDSGQRIYSRSFNLNSLGINVRGRSSNLKINYRTTEQIRQFADKLLSDIGDDMDGGNEERNKTKSILRGPNPLLKGFTTKAEQSTFIINEVNKLVSQGLKLGDIAIFAINKSILDSISIELNNSNLKTMFLGDNELSNDSLSVNLGTMHRAKGLEFKVVFVIDVSSDNLPQRYIKNIADPIDKEHEINKEKSLLYVSVTRARDEVSITWVNEPSSFLGNLLSATN